jgi:alkylation response protein AidB-like acyl-CoA dehydrogenase
MDFSLNAEQLTLRSTVAAFCADRVPLSGIGAREGAPAADSVWNGLADLGVLGLLADGDELAAVEATVAFEALGTALVPGPVLWSTVMAVLLPEVGSGARRVTGVELSAGGAAAVVPHAAESQAVAALYPDRVECVDVSALSGGMGGTPLDPLTPCVGYEVIPTGDVVGDRAGADRVRLVGALLSAGMLVGLAQGVLDTAREYALEREQFDRPIGSFQAIKHLLADMFVRVELARSATYAAAATVAQPRSGDGRRATSAAKILAGEAAITNSRAGIQILGGMGFTWDMLPHYYLKRGWVLENSFGTGTAHSLLLADAVAAEVTR